MEANNSRYRFLQQANAARENWMAQYRKNIDQNLLNAASEYMKWGQYNDSLGIQNKMLGLYDRQIKLEEDKVRNGLPDTRV
jgi:outer membrane protein TolC